MMTLCENQDVAAPARSDLSVSAHRFPKWARLSANRRDEAESDLHEAAAFGCAAFAAGASLAALHAILTSGEDGAPTFRPAALPTVAPPFFGAFQARQALTAAARCVSLARPREDEAALRDAIRLTASEANTSPAGRIHLFWRLFGEQAGELLGGAADFEEIADTIRFRANHAGDPLGQTLEAGRETMRIAANGAFHRDAAESLALWVADIVLAKKLGWAQPVALLATRITLPIFFDHGKRVRPDDPAWPGVAARAYAMAAADAHLAAVDLGRRTEKLLAVAPKLRAKPAGRVVEMLLADDSVTASASARATGMSDRAARRLFDRLAALGGARELTGRETFRIYGI